MTCERVGLQHAAGVGLGGVGDDQHVRPAGRDRGCRRNPGSNSDRPPARHRARNSGSRSAAAGTTATITKHVGRAEPARAARASRRRAPGSTMARRTSIDVGANRVAEDDDLDDRHQRDDRQRPAIAQDVVDLLPQQADERVRRHRGCPAARGRAPSPPAAPACTNTSSIDRGAELLLQLGGRPDGADPSRDHDRDAVAVLGLVHVVRGHEHGRARRPRPRRSAPRTGGGVIGSTPLVGSSRNTMRGWWRSATENASFCRQPSGIDRTNRSRRPLEAEPRQHRGRCARESARSVRS